MKPVRIVILTIAVFLGVWVFGLISGLELNPTFQTNFYLGDAGLDRPIILNEKGEQQLELLIPWDFDDSELRDIDLTIYPYGEKHNITINRMSANVATDGNKLTPKYFYVFDNNGKELKLDSVKNDTISTYILIRSVYPLRDVKKFQLHIKADYLYNKKPHHLDTTLNVVHETRLKWKGLSLWSN